MNRKKPRPIVVIWAAICRDGCIHKIGYSRSIVMKRYDRGFNCGHHRIIKLKELQ